MNFFDMKVIHIIYHNTTIITKHFIPKQVRVG
jgi:hypothetical protein